MIIITVLISLSSYAYNAQDLMDFLQCYNQPTHIVTGEPLPCNDWDLDNDFEVGIDDLLILLDEFGE